MTDEPGQTLLDEERDWLARKLFAEVRAERPEGRQAGPLRLLAKWPARCSPEYLIGCWMPATTLGTATTGTNLAGVRPRATKHDRERS
ncbi:hypothetical protein GCM10007890_02090 [Methylobacterium tardum]|uniref:Uncharacterized protein n=1 Tax=Methylobacterium tardum TaxID=374432 RepID=A0AA37TA59_9HYPH|nr:hypothetical protein GCM10007890_02090 [Methylobacterium tardum]